MITVKVTLTYAGADASLFDIYSIGDSGIPELKNSSINRNILEGGLNVIVDDDVRIIRVCAIGGCDGCVDMQIDPIPQPTTLPPTPPEVYSFIVKYDSLPVDACSGTSDTAYALVATPNVGDIIYKDIACTQPWDKDTAIIFYSPNLFWGDVALVAVNEGTYSVGEIMTLSGYLCSDLTTTIPPTTSAPIVINISNTSTDVIITDVQIDGVSVSGISFPITTGNSDSGTISDTVIGIGVPITVSYTFTTGNQNISIAGASPVCESAAASPYSSTRDIGAADTISIVASDGACV